MKTKHYYENFSNEYLTKDFFSRNPRHERISYLISKFICKNASVLDVGCGVGINAREISKITKKITCLDISKNNIEKAKIVLNDDRIDFVEYDLIEWNTTKKYDIITLFDVVEHIPKDSLGQVMGKLKKLLHEKGLIILSYPSPEYQDFLKIKSPEKLQVIDERVEISELLHYGFKLKYFEYIDIWKKNQYCHAALTVKNSLDELETEKKVFLIRFLNVCKKKSKHLNWFLKNIFIRFRLKQAGKTNR